MTKAKTPRKKTIKKGKPEQTLLQQARRYNASGAVKWANSKTGRPLVMSYAAALYEYGFTEDEINSIIPSLIFNTYLFIKLY